MRISDWSSDVCSSDLVWPLLAAIFTAGFFLLLTVQSYRPGLVSGVIAILCVLRWLWETDRPVAVQSPDAGAGIALPTYVTGPRTPGWWAMVILLIVIGMIFLMTIFRYLYLYGIHPQKSDERRVGKEC